MSRGVFVNHASASSGRSLLDSEAERTKSYPEFQGCRWSFAAHRAAIHHPLPLPLCDASSYDHTESGLRSPFSPISPLTFMVFAACAARTADASATCVPHRQTNCQWGTWSPGAHLPGVLRGKYRFVCRSSLRAIFSTVPACGWPVAETPGSVRLTHLPSYH